MQINISAQNTIHLCEGDTAENFAVPANNGSTYNWTIQGPPSIANIVSGNGVFFPHATPIFLQCTIKYLQTKEEN